MPGLNAPPRQGGTGQTYFLEEAVPRCRSIRWDDIFPIADAPSARLMKIKAACLMRAGVITALQKSEIDRRAGQAIARAEKHVPLRRTHAAGKRAA